MHCIWLLDLYSSPVFPWITQSWHFRRLLDNYFAECLVVLLFHDSGCVALEGVSQKWWQVFPLHPSRGHRDLILLSLRKFTWIPCLWRICQTLALQGCPLWLIFCRKVVWNDVNFLFLIKVSLYSLWTHGFLFFFMDYINLVPVMIMMLQIVSDLPSWSPYKVGPVSFYTWPYHSLSTSLSSDMVRCSRNIL